MTTTTHQQPAATREPQPWAIALVERMQIELSPAGLALLREGDTSPAFFARLLSQHQLIDARLFLAHALSVRRALWWSCLCAHDVCGEGESGLRTAIDAVVRYVQTPTETHRRIAEESYRANPKNPLARAISAAAFFSAGGIGPRDMEIPISAPAFVTPRLVSTAVYVAATIKDAVEYQRVMLDYLHLGQQIAQGENLWPESDASAAFTRIDLGGPLHTLAGPHRLAGVHCQCEGHA